MNTAKQKIETIKELIAANRETLAASPADFEDYEEYNLAMVEARQNIAQFKAEIAELEANGDCVEVR